MTHHPECEDATGEYPGSCTCAIIKRREAMTEITQADCDVAEYIAGDRVRDVDYQVVARHRQYGYDQGYYDGRQADGAEERANERIEALQADNARLQAVSEFYLAKLAKITEHTRMPNITLQETGQ